MSIAHLLRDVQQIGVKNSNFYLFLEFLTPNVNFLVGYLLSKKQTMMKILQKGQDPLLEYYLTLQTPYPNQAQGYSLQSVYNVLNVRPDISKPAFREQILTFSIEKKETPESLKSFIASFRKSAGQIQNSLFRIEENYGYWVKMLGFSSPKTKVEPSDLPPDFRGQGGSVTSHSKRDEPSDLPPANGGLRGVNLTNKKALKQQQKQDFFAWLNTTALNQETRAFIQDTSKPLRERTIALYKALEEIRSHLLAQAHTEHHSEKAIKNISQAMANLVHTVGFRNQAWAQGLKSKDPEVAFQALRHILNERDIVAFDLGFEGHFKELKEALGSKIPDETKVLNQIQEDINQPSHKEDGSTPLSPALQGGPAERIPLSPALQGGPAERIPLSPALQGGEQETTLNRGDKDTQVFRLRALSLQESAFRSCLGGDCATWSYFETGLDPNYIYFTLTDKQHKSSGHITVVLGTAKNKEGKNIPVAFVDKIQNMTAHKLMAILEGISLSVKEQGYVLALPKDVGDMNGLANEGFIRDYVKSHILPELQNPLTHFKPHTHKYSFPDGYSRAGQKKLDLLEFVSNPPGPPSQGGTRNNPLDPGGTRNSPLEPGRTRGVEIRAGDLPTLQLASPTLSVRSLYESILKLKDSRKEEDQLKFLSHLINLNQIEGLNISDKDVREHLDFVLKNPEFSFSVRKKALYTLIKFNVSIMDFGLGNKNRSRYQSVLFDFLEKQGMLFSQEEQKALIGEMSNWKNSKGYKKEFIRYLNEYEIHKVVDSKMAGLEQIKQIFNTPYGVLLDKNSWLISFSDYGRADIVQYVLNDPAVDVNHKSGSRMTALITAVFQGRLDVIKILLKAGADLNIQDNSGATALMVAIRKHSIKKAKEIIKELLNAGADLEIKNNKGMTALMIAVQDSHTEIIQELINAGADINAQANGGWTALMLALLQGNLTKFIQLLNAGADPNIQNDKGETALIIVAENGWIEAIKALLEAGADIHTKDHRGWTAVIAAKRKGHTQLAQILADRDVKQLKGIQKLKWHIKLFGQYVRSFW